MKFGFVYYTLFFFSSPANAAGVCSDYIQKLNQTELNTTESNSAKPNKTQTTSAYKVAQQTVLFPPEGEFYTFEYLLRIAIHEAFEGLDFYTDEPLDFLNMSIDHVLPRALGGPDNVFNFVPTSPKNNSKKGHKFTYNDLETLQIVKEIYGPKVMELLKHYGAFDDRENSLRSAVQINAFRRNYTISRMATQQSLSVLDPEVYKDKLALFRRKPDFVSFSLQYVILAFARALSDLNESSLEKTLDSQVFKFKIDKNSKITLAPEDLNAFNISMTYRPRGRKVIEERLAVQRLLFDVTQFEVNKVTGDLEVEIKFHPMFALKLLETPKDQAQAEAFISNFFKPSDIKIEEFKDWIEL